MGLDNTQIKPLSEILVIEDQIPSDFYTNDIYEKRLDAAIKASNNLVYPVDDEGEKQAKKDVASINKFAKSFKKFALETFREKTGPIKLWKDSSDKKTSELLKNGEDVINQFLERREQKLKDIKSLLLNELNLARDRKGIEERYYVLNTDFSSLLKLTGTLTAKGLLTKKANDFISALASAELAEQTRIEARHLLLENSCLKADINPPLTCAHMGGSFYADDDVFNAKAEELIALEISRKESLKAKIIKDQEESNQKKLDDALKAQQDEANRAALENLGKSRQEEQCELEEQDLSGNTTIKPTPVNQPVAAKKQAVANGKHQVQIQVTFTMSISDSVTDKTVQDFFLKQLPEKLKSAIDNLSTRSL